MIGRPRRRNGLSGRNGLKRSFLRLISGCSKFVVKSREMWPRHEIGSDGTYYAYFPFEPMIERPQIAAFHNKFMRRSYQKEYSPPEHRGCRVD